nr:hypothetical protein [Tanacetum cinerariifolium]
FLVDGCCTPPQTLVVTDDGIWCGGGYTTMVLPLKPMDLVLVVAAFHHRNYRMEVMALAMGVSALPW